MSKSHKTILQEETEDGGTFLECQHLGNKAGRSEVQGHSWIYIYPRIYIYSSRRAWANETLSQISIKFSNKSV